MIKAVCCCVVGRGVRIQPPETSLVKINASYESLAERQSTV